MDEIKLTISQIANEIGESVHTCRNWFKDYRDYIPHVKDKNGYNLFTREGLEIFLKIKRMFRDQKLTARQIGAILAGAELPTAAAAESPKVDDLAEIKKMLAQQQEFNHALIQRLDKQQQFIEHALQLRDQQLTETLRLMQDRKKRRWWTFWTK